MKKELNDDVDYYGQAIPEAPFSDLYKLAFANRGYAKVIVIWGTKISKKKQILQLKRHCRDLKGYASVELYEMAKGKNEEWEFAEMGFAEAKDFAVDMKKFGLEIKVIKKED